MHCMVLCIGMCIVTVLVSTFLKCDQLTKILTQERKGNAFQYNFDLKYIVYIMFPYISDGGVFCQSWFAGPHNELEDWRFKFKTTVDRRGVQLLLIVWQINGTCLSSWWDPLSWRCWNDKAHICGLPNGFQCGLLGHHLRDGTTELSGEDGPSLFDSRFGNRQPSVMSCNHHLICLLNFTY